jgi:hypothetical protein
MARKQHELHSYIVVTVMLLCWYCAVVLVLCCCVGIVRYLHGAQGCGTPAMTKSIHKNGLKVECVVQEQWGGRRWPWWRRASREKKTSSWRDKLETSEQMWAGGKEHDDADLSNLLKTSRATAGICKLAEDGEVAI